MAFQDPFSKLSLRNFVLLLSGGITVFSLYLTVTNFDKQPAKVYRHSLTNHTKDSSFSTPTFKVKKDVLYRIEVRNIDISSSWMVAGLSILNDDDEVINEKEMEFWHESGYDSDGAWSEGNYTEKFNFKAAKDGQLSAEIYWLESKSKIPESHKFIFRVRETGTSLISNYFQNVFMVFLVITIFMIFIWRK